MLFRGVFLLSLTVPLSWGTVIRSVHVEGTGQSVPLSTKANTELDPATLTADVRALWATGALEDLRVEQTDGEGGVVDIVFRAREKQKLYLDKVEFSRRSPSRKVDWKPGAVIDTDKARELAKNLERQLKQEGYAHGRVHFDLIPSGYKRASLMFDVDEGDRYTVWRNNFDGDPELPAEELDKALHATRTKRILGGMFHVRPAYSDDAVDSDLQRLRSLYTSHGYFDARVGLGGVKYEGDHVLLTYTVDAGRKYPVGPSGELPVREVCRCILEARARADHQGRTEFQPKLVLKPAITGRGLSYTTEFETGEPWYVSRIGFSGNHKFSDTTLRQALLLDEGDPFDQTRLSRSIVRLNRLGLLETVTERNVQVVRNQATRTVRLEFAIKEAPMGRWSLSGPVGTVAMGGSLQGGVTGRLPGWGRGLLELPTYFAAVSFVGFADPWLKLIPGAQVRQWMPYLSVQRPFLAGQGWKSGFTVAPQLGLKGMGAMYGMTQVQGRLRNLLVSDNPREAPVVVAVERAGAEAQSQLICEDQVSRWNVVRGGIAMAAEFFLFARTF